MSVLSAAAMLPAVPVPSFENFEVYDGGLSESRQMFRTEEGRTIAEREGGTETVTWGLSRALAKKMTRIGRVVTNSETIPPSPWVHRAKNALWQPKRAGWDKRNESKKNGGSQSR